MFTSKINKARIQCSVPGTVDGQDVQTLVAVNSALSNAAQMHSQLTLFSSANQILQGARGQVITGKPGTLMSADKDIIILHKGALTVNSGEAPATVKTRCGDLRIKERSVVVVDDQGKDLHVKAISGGENVVEIRSSYKNNVVTAQSGKELIVSDSGIDEEELISTEGTEAIISGAIEKRPQIADTRYVPASEEITSKISQRAGRHVRLGHAPSMVSPMQIVVQNSTQFEQNKNGGVKLANGSLFLAPSEDSEIDCKFGRVSVKRNGMMMLEQRAGLCRVKALSGPGDIEVALDNQRINLAPGQELLIADHLPNETELNPADAIARRSRVKVSSMGSVNVAINDFSIGSVLNYAGYRQMTTSSNIKLERVLKIAAVVEIVGRGRGQYAYSSLYQLEQKATVQAQKISSAKIK